MSINHPRHKLRNKKNVSRVLLVLLASLLLLTISLVFAHKVRSYNSDDVSWQNIVRTWSPHRTDNNVVLGQSDNFLNKLPFFWFSEKLFGSSRKALFIESYVLAVSGFTLYYFSSLYFLKKLKIEFTYRNLLPFAWLGSFGFAYAELYLNPIWRGFEMGLYFALFTLIAMYIHSDIKPFKNMFTKTLVLLVTALFGVLIFSDVFIVYFFIGPMCAWLAWLRFRNKVTNLKLISVFGFLFVSFLFSIVTSNVFSRLGFHLAIDYPVELVQFGALPRNIIVALHAMMLIFGADVFGRSPFSLIAIGALINLALISYLGALIYKSRSGLKKNASQGGIENGWITFFVLLIMFVFAIYAMSTVSAYTSSTYRYFVTAAMATPILLSYFISRKAKLLVHLLAVSLVLNVVISMRYNQHFLTRGTLDNVVVGQSSYTGNQANSLNFKIIDLLKKEGISKGYANFWQAGINTYLSKGDVELLPITCESDKTITFKWLLDETRFEVPAAKTAVIIDPDFYSPALCTHDQMIKQFGKPDHEFEQYGKQFMFYNYDIHSKMPR